MSWRLAPIFLIACHARGRERPVPLDAAATSPSPAPLATAWDGELALASLPDIHEEGTELGTPDPTDNAFGDPKQRWALICQGTPKPAWRFVLGAGKGIVLDDLEAKSPNGDYLVAGWHGQTSLFDIRGGKIIALTRAPSVAGFSADGERLVYVDHQELVRRDLASGQSVRVALPEGKPHVVDVDTSGSWAMVTIERLEQHDTYGGIDTNFCGVRDKYSPNAYLPRGVPVWIDLETGETREDKHIVRVAGGHVFSRREQLLFLDDKPIGPTDCANGSSILDAMTVVGVVESPPRALVLCVRPKGPLTLSLVAPKATLVKLDAPLSDVWSRRVAPMVTGRELCAQIASMEDTCIDLTTGAVRKRAAPPSPFFGPHDGVWWYAAAETGKVLVGPGEKGPLHWQ